MAAKNTTHSIQASPKCSHRHFRCQSLILTTRIIGSFYFRRCLSPLFHPTLPSITILSNSQDQFRVTITTIPRHVQQIISQGKNSEVFPFIGVQEKLVFSFYRVKNICFCFSFLLILTYKHRAAYDGMVNHDHKT